MKDGFIKRVLEYILDWKYPSPPPPTPDLPLFSDAPEGAPIDNFRLPRPDELVLGSTTAKGPDGKEEGAAKGVAHKNRSTHFYVVGATGTGKTKFLETLIVQDAMNAHGFGVVDAHGDLAEDVKGYLFVFSFPEKTGNPDELSEKIKKFLSERVVLIDPSDLARTTCFNPIERTAGFSPAEIAGETTEAFKKIWRDSWGARMEDLLKNSLIALVENGLTLVELPLFLTDAGARKKILNKVVHPVCRQYFERFNALGPRLQDEWMESTMNKVNAFLSDDAVRQMLSAQKSTFNFREIMDGRKILIAKLNRGRLKGSADILGSLILAKIQMAAFSRTDVPQSERVPFYLYIDEFQNFATESFIQTLAEARKYGLSLTLAHQNLAQLPLPLRASVLSNCGLQAYFRISRDDANILAKESLASVYQETPGWEFYIRSLQELRGREFVVKHKIAGGVVALRAIDLPPPWELAKMEERKFAEALGAMNIGGAYLRKRDEIEKEYRQRRETLMSGEEPESFAEKK